MKKRGLASIALSCVLAAGLFVVPTVPKDVHASAAPAYEEGITSSEIILLSGETAVEVEKEKLTFHAEHPPKTYPFENYHDTVRAEYALYNPSEKDETLRLALPLGSVRNYYYAYGNFNIENEYTVTVDGERVETRLHHSYLTDYDAPTAESLTRVSELFREDTPVRGYTYTVTLPNGYNSAEAYKYALELELNYDADKAFPFTPDVHSNYLENGNMQFEFWLGSKVTSCNLYVAGEAAEFVSARVINTDEDVEIDGAEIFREENEASTFADYVRRSPFEEVEYEDWVRACGNYLDTCYPYADKPDYGELYRYAEYEITVPAGGRVTHAVETPLIPTIRSSQCYYSYSFDGARGWANYEGLDVEIYAESAPQHGTLNFTAGEGVYTHGRSNLPMRALHFSLGEYEESSWTGFGQNDLQIALIILAVLAVIAGVTVLIIVKVRRKRLKTLEMRAAAEAQAKRENTEKSDEEEKK